MNSMQFIVIVIVVSPCEYQNSSKSERKTKLNIELSHIILYVLKKVVNDLNLEITVKYSDCLSESDLEKDQCN